MIRYGAKTRLAPEGVVAKARKHFGPEGIGLKITNEGSCCISFEGSGGFVKIDVAISDDGKSTDVDLQAREWEYEAGRFMKSIR